MTASRSRPVAVFTTAAAAIALAVGVGGAQGSVGTHATANTNPNTTIYPTVYVNYTDQCTFTITNDEGQVITQIPPGTYQVNVNTPTLFYLNNAGSPGSDLTACNGWVQFQMTGPNVNLATTLDDGGDDTQTLPATYFAPSSTFVALDNDDPSATQTTFTTSASGNPAIPDCYCGGPPAPTRRIGGPELPVHRFGAILSANGTATLMNPVGKPALNIPLGIAAITVKDFDARATLVIQQNGSPAIKLTPAKFVGHKTIDVLFTPGIWKYYASPRGTVHTFVVIG